MTETNQATTPPIDPIPFIAHHNPGDRTPRCLRCRRNPAELVLVFNFKNEAPSGWGVVRLLPRFRCAAAYCTSCAKQTAGDTPRHDA